MSRLDARSYESVDDADLGRLGRAADCDLARFFARNPRLEGWRERVAAVALAQGAAEHRVRGVRGIWDLDVIVCFAESEELPRLFRRQPVSWDWGPSRFGRCRFDPASYAGRAVDVMLWVIPDLPDPADALRLFMSRRLEKKPNPARHPDVAHEPVILIRPGERLGDVVWDPQMAPPAKSEAPRGHRRPAGMVPA